MKAIRQYAFGRPDELRYEDAPDPEPGSGQVRVAVEVAGVHLLDTTIRHGGDTGPLPRPELPMTPGREVAGTIDAAGPDVDASWLGRRVVVHLGMASGGYASMAVANVDDLFELSDHVDAAAAVAMVGTGRTALGILEAADIGTDDVVLITAAAGGIGALLVQAAKAAGATVVGVAGGKDKVAAVRRLGADITVDYRAGEPWTDRVRTSLDGTKITLALDGVGGEVGRATFESVAPGGRMVIFGYSSGVPMPLDTVDLFGSGATVTAAIGARMMSRPGGIRPLSAAALDALAAGRLTPLVHPPFALADAADAHRALESRATMGKVILTP